MDEQRSGKAAAPDARWPAKQEPAISTQLSLPPPRRGAGTDGAASAAAGGEGADAGEAAGACLEVDELVAMVDGTLSSERSDAVLAHVDACPTCADLVGNLGVLSEEPRKLGRYRVERLLGVGGMGMVYRAWDPELQRPVAIKLVRPEHASERSKARMLGEARALARVSHPNVIGVYDVGEHAGEIFLATELVEGETLVTWKQGRSAAALVDAWLQVARGLAAAHAEGVVHRDVKPANVLVGRDGRMRIGDFGIAYQLGGAAGDSLAPARETEQGKQAEGSAAKARGKAGTDSGSAPGSGSASASASDSASDSGSDSASGSASVSASGRPSAYGTPAKAITVSEVVGTPAYMAPEQHEGKVDARSDQFSVCVALVEALLGRRPVPGEHVDLTTAPGIPAAVAAALTGVLHRGLRADPALRFPSMTAFGDALAAAMQPPQPRRSRARFASLALGAALLVAAGGLALSRRSSAEACTAVAVPPSLWSPARRLQLKGVLPADPDPLVRTWLAEHKSMAADVCTATPSDVAMRKRRNACLGELQRQLDQQLTRWQWAAPRDALSMFSALAALPRPSRCSQAALRLTPDPSPAQAAELATLRKELRELRAPTRAAALAATAALVERARATGYAPAAIELGRALAAVQASDDRAGARRTLRAAIDFGAQQGDGFERVTAMVELISLADSVADAEALAQRARARLTALGGDRLLEGTLDYNLGRILHEKHRSDDALAAFERARHGFRAVEGEAGLHEAVVLVSIAGVHYQRGTNNKAGDDALTAAGAIFKAAGVEVPIRAPEVESAALIAQLQELRALAEASGPRTESMFNAEHALASAYLLAEDPDHALEHYRNAAELGEALGLRNDKLVYSLTQSASILMDRKQLDEAEAPMRRALALARQLGIEVELASALVAQGRWLLERGQPAAARAPLAEALELRSRSNEPARFRGGSRFLLAQALWDAEPKRALELAHAARVDLQDMLESTPPGARGAAYQRKVTEELIEKVDRWLASRSR